MSLSSQSPKLKPAAPAAEMPGASAIGTGSASAEPGSNRRVPAWLLSFVFHGLVFIGLFWALSAFPRGAGVVENRAGGIVLVNQDSTTTEYLSEGDVLESSQQPEASSSPPPAATDLELPPDLPGLAASPATISGAGDSLLESLPGAESLIIGAKPSGKIGGAVTTEVFGIKGTGTRFVYVFDRSKSMDGFNSRPMLAARRQLLESIESLADTHQFQIIFYNDQVKMFNPDGMRTMYFATDDVKNQAKKFIRSVRPDGGTDHITALKAAFRLAPDVIFLLTDAEGGFTPLELRDLRRFNRSGAVINAIEFGERRGSDRSLSAVAGNSGGQYVFKNIHSLRIDGN